MKGEKILLSQKQLQRFRIVGLVESGRTSLEEAAVKIGVSYSKPSGSVKGSGKKESRDSCMGMPAARLNIESQIHCEDAS